MNYEQHKGTKAKIEYNDAASGKLSQRSKIPLCLD